MSPEIDKNRQRLAELANKLNIPRIQRHIFICADPAAAKCCDQATGLAAWDFLKRRIKELDLATQVFRTKANCLRVCEQGPIVVIYPDAVWYHSATELVLEKILQEHVIAGKIVAEFAFAVPPGIVNFEPLHSQISSQNL